MMTAGKIYVTIIIYDYTAGADFFKGAVLPMKGKSAVGRISANEIYCEIISLGRKTTL